MTGTTLSSFVIILAVAAVAPILSDLSTRFVPIPSVVLEIGLGAAVGPAALGWAHDDEIISFVSELGLATLMFLAGLEVDFRRIRGRPLRLAVAGWGLSLVLGLGAGIILAATSIDSARSGLVVGLALTTTAFGTLLPILRDSGELARPFGVHVLAGAAVGEVGPILAVALLLSSDRPARTAVFLVGFVVVTLGAGYVAGRPRHPRLARLMEATLITSGQLAVRIVVLLTGFMVWLASELGLDVLLGAFAAGLVFRIFSRGAGEREAELVEAKLQGLGFGFLVPFFFIVSGLRFDLDALLHDLGAALRVPMFLGLFLVVRGLPTVGLHRRTMGRRDRRALALYLATELPLVVVITTIGVQTHRMRSSTAAALVGAAMLSVLVYPLLAAALRRPAIEAGQPPQVQPVISGGSSP